LRIISRNLFVNIVGKVNYFKRSKFAIVYVPEAVTVDMWYFVVEASMHLLCSIYRLTCAIAEPLRTLG
jgi:hypothetical protein